MAAIARDSSRFAGVKAFSEKFSQPEVDADGRIRKVGIKRVSRQSSKGLTSPPVRSNHTCLEVDLSFPGAIEGVYLCKLFIVLFLCKYMRRKIRQ